jgi:hypothetical protein
MTTLTREAGSWSYILDGVHGELRMPWAATITERAEIRHEIASLCDQAHALLGTTPRVLRLRWAPAEHPVNICYQTLSRRATNT